MPPMFKMVWKHLRDSHGLSPDFCSDCRHDINNLGIANLYRQCHTTSSHTTPEYTHLPSASHVFQALRDHSQARSCRTHHHPLPSPASNDDGRQRCSNRDDVRTMTRNMTKSPSHPGLPSIGTRTYAAFFPPRPRTHASTRTSPSPLLPTKQATGVDTSPSRNVKRQQTSNGPGSAAQCPFNAILVPQAGNLIRG